MVFQEQHTREGVSKFIQSKGLIEKEFLALFNKDAVRITWPSEIEETVNQYGFDLISVNDLDLLNPEKDIAIVLIHGKFFSEQYHWVVYPINDVKNFYGKKTVIDKIYLLKWRKKGHKND
tara:strand:- start:1135 stop:1494 length:360 start_codon:yes stop_codon:yes gene_type:complete